MARVSVLAGAVGAVMFWIMADADDNGCQRQRNSRCAAGGIDAVAGGDPCTRCKRKSCGALVCCQGRGLLGLREV